MKRKLNRSSVTGKFVTEEFAKANPRETVRETVKTSDATPQKENSQVESRESGATDEDAGDAIEAERPRQEHLSAPANLPPFLMRTPQQLGAEKARQDTARAAHSRGARLSRAERMLSRASLVENAIRANLAQLDRRKQAGAWRETMVQLAEALAEQGKFEEAAQTAKEAGNTDLYYECLRLDAAVWRNDSDDCNCDRAHQFTLREIWSEKHRALVPVKTCAVCNLANAK